MVNFKMEFERLNGILALFNQKSRPISPITQRPSKWFNITLDFISAESTPEASRYRRFI